MTRGMQRRAIGHSLSHTPPTPSSPPPPSPSSSMSPTKELTSSSPCSISSSPWVPAMNLKSAVIYSSNERASGELLHLSSNEFPPTTFFIDLTFWCHYPYTLPLIIRTTIHYQCTGLTMIALFLTDRLRDFRNSLLERPIGSMQ